MSHRVDLCVVEAWDHADQRGCPHLLSSIGSHVGEGGTGGWVGESHTRDSVCITCESCPLITQCIYQ